MPFQEGHPSYLTKESIKRISEAKKNHPCYKDKNRNFKISQSKIGKKLSKETKEKISKSKTGLKIHTEKWKKFLSEKFKGERNPAKLPGIGEKISRAKSGKSNWKIKGKNHYCWKGGTTSIYQKIRKSIQYKRWRNLVFKRDNYTCQFCKQVRGEINADHIKPFAFYPELRFKISNGRTLCISCHKKTNSYLNRWFKRSKT